jgi:hypothetical protein
MTARIVRYVAPIMALCALAACKGREDMTEHTETRALSGFTAIDLKGGAELTIAVGKSESVVIRATHDTLTHLRTEVKDHTLFVRRDSEDWSFGRSRNAALTISLPKLTSLELEGGNHVAISGLDGGETRVVVRGATRMEASGKLDRLTIHMQGAGDADFSKLIAQAVEVTVEGVGKVKVNAQQKLAATMNGLGAISYSGHPTDVSTHLNGFGSISQSDEGDAPQADSKKTPPSADDLQPEYEEKKTGAQQSTPVI